MALRVFNFHQDFTTIKLSALTGQPSFYAKGQIAYVYDEAIQAEIDNAPVGTATDWTAIATLANAVDARFAFRPFTSADLTGGVLFFVHNFGRYPAGLMIYTNTGKQVLAPTTHASDLQINIDLSSYQVSGTWAAAAVAAGAE